MSCTRLVQLPARDNQRAASTRQRISFMRAILACVKLLSYRLFQKAAGSVGLWQKFVKSVVVDRNSGIASVTPTTSPSVAGT